jgi:flagellar hook protein FlgE
MPFRIALTGLHAASTDLKVTGNNIANSATMGFKRSRAEFVDVYAHAQGAITSATPGSGVRTPNIRQMFAQGNVEFTDNNTDLAITGQGFFVMADEKGQYLTRNGTFGLDKDNEVVNSTGQNLQVFPAVTVGQNTTFNTGSLVDLRMSSDVGAPNATTSVDTNINVDGNVTPILVDVVGGGLGDDSINTFQPTDPNTFHHVTATTAYDSLGAPHVMTMYYRKIDDNTTPGSVTNAWQVFTEIDGNRVNPFDAGLPGPVAGPAIMQFNSDGSVASVTPAGGLSGSHLDLDTYATTTGSAPLNLSFDYGKTTQYGSEFAVNDLSNDGYTTGRLTGFEVSDNGIVSARYTNGNAEVLGMVALANVANPQGLGQKGDSLWVETHDGGEIVLGQPGTASLGLIQSGALEASTVDVADELVNMIVAQRNYQANAQVISTADQITQTLLQIR